MFIGMTPKILFYYKISKHRYDWLIFIVLVIGNLNSFAPLSCPDISL